MKKNNLSLKQFMTSLLQEGRISFSFKEAYKYHGGTKSAVQQALYRLN